LRAGEIARNREAMSARDALHIAIMERHGIRSIFSFDADFDRWPGLQRIHRI
jgi:predicted nucleic acid-binding protein